MISAKAWTCAIILFATAALAAGTPEGWMADESPGLPAYSDLVMLSESELPGAAVEQKLQQVLETPIVSNAAARSGAQPKRPVVEGRGPLLRLALWNLENGRNLDLVRFALNRPAELLKQATDAGKRSTAEWQARILRDADVLVLNEVDLGVSRTNYRDVAGELAAELHVNYAFGAEFVEVDPLLLGLERPPGNQESIQAWTAGHPISKQRFRGLEGNAVLSRYPILNARVVRLPECYDWYAGEKESIAELEKGRRWTAQRVFEERVSRQIRRGGRMALIVDLSVPEAPGGVVTVVSTHLENRCDPACRERQMDAVMNAVAGVSNAVVIGGDLNTSGRNEAPTSFRREVGGRAKSPSFWLETAARYFVPSPIAGLSLLPANRLRIFLDPSVFHFPLFLANRESGLFKKVRKFRFKDGGAFDFSGASGRTRDGRGKTLANSNQRALKGFASTYGFKRTFRGLLGRYKLDWFFVKPGADGRLAPEFPVTMNELNEVTGVRISDHAPMTVDLPFTTDAP